MTALGPDDPAVKLVCEGPPNPAGDAAVRETDATSGRPPDTSGGAGGAGGGPRPSRPTKRARRQLRSARASAGREARLQGTPTPQDLTSRLLARFSERLKPVTIHSCVDSVSDYASEAIKDDLEDSGLEPNLNYEVHDPWTLLHATDNAKVWNHEFIQGCDPRTAPAGKRYLLVTPDVLKTGSIECAARSDTVGSTRVPLACIGRPYGHCMQIPVCHPDGTSFDDSNPAEVERVKKAFKVAADRIKTRAKTHAIDAVIFPCHGTLDMWQRYDIDSPRIHAHLQAQIQRISMDADGWTPRSKATTDTALNSWHGPDSPRVLQDGLSALRSGMELGEDGGRATASLVADMDEMSGEIAAHSQDELELDNILRYGTSGPGVQPSEYAQRALADAKESLFLSEDCLLSQLVEEARDPEVLSASVAAAGGPLAAIKPTGCHLRAHTSTGAALMVALDTGSTARRGAGSCVVDPRSAVAFGWRIDDSDRQVVKRAGNDGSAMTAGTAYGSLHLDGVTLPVMGYTMLDLPGDLDVLLGYNEMSEYGIVPRPDLGHCEFHEGPRARAAAAVAALGPAAADSPGWPVQPFVERQATSQWKDKFSSSLQARGLVRTAAQRSKLDVRVRARESLLRDGGVDPEVFGMDSLAASEVFNAYHRVSAFESFVVPGGPDGDIEFECLTTDAQWDAAVQEQEDARARGQFCTAITVIGSGAGDAKAAASDREQSVVLESLLAEMSTALQDPDSGATSDPAVVLLARLCGGATLNHAFDGDAPARERVAAEVLLQHKKAIDDLGTITDEERREILSKFRPHGALPLDSSICPPWLEKIIDVDIDEFKQQRERIKREYADECFDEKKMSYTHACSAAPLEFVLKPDEKHTTWFHQSKIAEALRPVVDKFLDAGLARGWLKEAPHSHTVSRMLLTPKAPAADGTSRGHRALVDARTLNNKLLAHRTTIDSTEDILSNMERDAEIFSSGDCANGFYSVRLSDKKIPGSIHTS